MEEWKDIKEFSGIYQVSSSGEIRRVAFSNGIILSKPKYLKSSERRDGYVTVVLYDGSGKFTRYVHRLVAAEFLPRIPGKSCVNHIDSDRSNNIVTNLEWCTYRENTQHALINGRFNYPKGEKHQSAKLTDEQAKQIKYCFNDLRHADIADRFGISRQCVQFIRSGRTWSHI